AGVVRQQILLLRPNGRKWFSPKFNTNLALWGDCAGWKTTLDNEKGCVRSQLLQTEWRFVLADLNLRRRKPMPVEPNVGSRKVGAVGWRSAIAILEIAFHFEIELLGKFAGQADPCPAQAETILQRGLTEAPFECGYVAVFKIRLDESAQHQLQFRPTLLHVNRRFLFFDNGFLDIRFSVVSDFLFQFPLRRIRSLSGFQVVDFCLQISVAFLQQLHCALEFFDSRSLRR